jgi:hypothetical protein
VLCVMNPASTDIENIIVTVPCNHTVAYWITFPSFRQ